MYIKVVLSSQIYLNTYIYKYILYTIYIFIHVLGDLFCLYHSPRATITLKSSTDRKVYANIGLKFNHVC